MGRERQDAMSASGCMRPSQQSTSPPHSQLKRKHSTDSDSGYYYSDSSYTSITDTTTTNKRAKTDHLIPKNDDNANGEASSGDECGSGSVLSGEGDRIEVTVDTKKKDTFMTKVSFYVKIKHELLALVDPKRKKWTENDVNTHYYNLYNDYYFKGGPGAITSIYACKVAPSRSLKYHVFTVMKRYLTSVNILIKIKSKS
jgi:hypothetical protein